MIVYAIYTIITLICIRSHICRFILRFSYFSIIHIFLYFYHTCIYSFLYSYMLIIRVHVLIPGNILYLVNLYLHVLYYTIISYDKYLYISILYVLLVLYQIVLSPIGVQNIDFFFNTLRYPTCPNYLPFLSFFIQIHTYKHSLAWTGDKE